ncbi:MAG: sigma-70 family RNA polymerase sigma factor [Sphingomonas sp.]|uniref:sigma-70 family RNA polymerase sigma factor n=1 Tax=Sphingomonas sp. TaxID=28214 RepID=UPI0018278D86|nr:sigma-70 family RNA polymerase sigma factor [Sphingomonas sp.]MBA3666195.1 sigma-70 family RNA polymerase sigma factor [Sphingomonas sp.]
MVGEAQPPPQFETMRPDLIQVAYRMLGSIADAEDVVQDAWLRWSSTDRSEVEAPQAFLRRVVIRLCLDQLKSARSRRETYVGPWLPEPTVEDEEVEDVTLPLMLALERLSPLERAAFLLHDVFGESFDDVAASLGRDAAACRQLASRARQNVRADRPRYHVDRKRGLEIASAFFAASRKGDIQRLEAMLAHDVGLYADGGGKRSAATQVIRGITAVTKLHAGLAKLFRLHPSTSVRFAFINGLPGFVTREADGMLQTTALLLVDDRIEAIYVMRNPDKLRHLEYTVH